MNCIRTQPYAIYFPEVPQFFIAINVEFQVRRMPIAMGLSTNKFIYTLCSKLRFVKSPNSLTERPHAPECRRQPK